MTHSERVEFFTGRGLPLANAQFAARALNEGRAPFVEGLHPRDRTGKFKRSVWHVSLDKHHSSITDAGLDWRKGGYKPDTSKGFTRGGNYVFLDRADAEAYGQAMGAEFKEKVNLYEVEGEGLDLKDDPQPGAEHDLGRSRYTDKAIEAKRVRHAAVSYDPANPPESGAARRERQRSEARERLAAARKQKPTPTAAKTPKASDSPAVTKLKKERDEAQATLSAAKTDEERAAAYAVWRRLNKAVRAAREQEAG